MKAWEITRKDLLLLRRDKRTVFSLIALPMIFITVIGLTFGQLLGWTNENQLLRIAVVDQVDYQAYYPRHDEIEDRPQLAKAGMTREWAGNIVTDLIDNLQKHDGVLLKKAETAEQAQRMYKEEYANAALIIGPDFIQRVMDLRPEDLLLPPQEGEQPSIDSLEDLDVTVKSEMPESPNTTAITVIVGDAMRETIQPYIVCSAESDRIAESGRLSQMCSDVRAKSDAPPKKREFVTKTPQGPRRDIYQFLVPGYTVMFVFFLVNMMGHSFLHEKELGTLRRLKAAPLHVASILAGKTTPFFIISLVQTGVLFLFGKLLFNMSWGAEPWLLLPIIVCTSLAATCLGLLLATLVRSESQVSAYGNFIVLLAGAISGCLMPREWLPEPMKKFSLITPHAWALESYREVLRSASPQVAFVLQNCAVMLAFAALYFFLGAWRFRTLE